MFRHLILATTIAVALSGCAQMAAGSRPHTDTGTPDISTFLHPENARPDGMSDIRYQL
ncbi:conjugal transfer protein, partial [Salmonella enterica]|nr:conjugal transfer protein [Salmonella enterica]